MTQGKAAHAVQHRAVPAVATQQTPESEAQVQTSALLCLLLNLSVWLLFHEMWVRLEAVCVTPKVVPDAQYALDIY